jgi:protein-serine/threonine kinase
MGVAHRDIKPENLLLDGRGHVKITDFGVSDVFRMCWEKKTHLSKGLCGSEPYIAPELFEHKGEPLRDAGASLDADRTEYDARFVDVWAAAVVFYCMQFQELPWRVAKSSDSTFSAYLQAYHPKHTLAEGERHPTPPPINNLVPRECRTVIKHMLDPDPKTRWSIDEALQDKWLMGVEVCKEGEVNGHAHTSAGMDIVKI